MNDKLRSDALSSICTHQEGDYYGVFFMRLKVAVDRLRYKVSWNKCQSHGWHQ